MPHKNEQLRIQDILYYTYLKTIDIGNALEVWKEKINDTNNNIYRIYMNSYIDYQSEITIIFPAKNGKLIAFDEGERKLILLLYADVIHF